MLCALLCVFLIPVTVCARAGGGGSGGGGGGGSVGGSSHSYRGGTGYYRSGGRASFASTAVRVGVLLLVGSGGSIAAVLRVRRSRRRSQAKMYEAAKFDTAWEYDKAMEQIENAFYCIQQAWTQRDVEIARQYLSRSLYQEYRSKLSWMAMRGERNVLENMKLLEISPVGVHDDIENSRDYLWCSIRASMVDYTIREDTGTVVSGNTSVPQVFMEYWQFVQQDGHWVLNQILQKDQWQKVPLEG